MAGAPIEISLRIDDRRWPDETTAIVDRTVTAVIAHLALAPHRSCELSILFTNDEHQRRLNERWRNIPASTNVLSFPQIEPFAPLSGLLGDISLAWETVAQEAEAAHKTLVDHVAHLCVHGFLHILGYNHVTDADAKEMETLERDILARLEIDDPYTNLAR